MTSLSTSFLTIPQPVKLPTEETTSPVDVSSPTLLVPSMASPTFMSASVSPPPGMPPLAPREETPSEPVDESSSNFLQTVCDQLEFYFCDENLLGDLYLLKNMNTDGYVKLDLLANFGRVKKLTPKLQLLRQGLELSTKLLLNEDGSMVCRKDPLPFHHTYHGKLARTAIAYNLPEDASIAVLKDKFRGCGEISYLRLLKKNTSTGRNAVLKPPIVTGETYAIIEYEQEEMARQAVLTLSDQFNSASGMQVVLFDGTNCDQLKQRLFPIELDRRRAKSMSAIGRAPVHVDAVGEGLDDLVEGKVSTGTVFSIRGAGGLIKPTRRENACISFRLVPDEDGIMDIHQGDYVSFTVGKNKKSGRKYASKVKLEFRPPSNVLPERDMNRWDNRNRSATIAGPPMLSRSRSTSAAIQRPKIQITPPMGLSKFSFDTMSAPSPLIPTISYRQAVGPDGSRGFLSRRLSNTSLTSSIPSAEAFSLEFGRRRAESSGAASGPPPLPSFPLSMHGFTSAP